MKKAKVLKLSILFLPLLLCFGISPAFSAWNFDWAFVQHRDYESGSSFKRLQFSISDSSTLPTSKDVVTSVSLTHPDGSAVTLDEGSFSSYDILNASYDSDGSQWSYGDFTASADFSYSFQDTLQTGDYDLKVTTSDGAQIETKCTFNGQVSLPALKSSSFLIRKDKSGNVFWNWDLPDELLVYASTGKTQLRAFIVASDNEGQTKALMYGSGPAHMGGWFIPDSVVQSLAAKGSNLNFGLQLRSRDNNNRYYTSTRTLTSDTITGYQNLITGVKMDAMGTVKVGTTVNFTALTNHAYDQTIYYKFNIVPKYGTPEYDANNVWSTIQDFSTSTTASYTFTEAGSYIIVVFARSEVNTPIDPAPIYGGAITVSE